ncbi:hypothetical protein FKM82_030789 [Ascaphus truei]
MCVAPCDLVLIQALRYVLCLRVVITSQCLTYLPVLLFVIRVSGNYHFNIKWWFPDVQYWGMLAGGSEYWLVMLYLQCQCESNFRNRCTRKSTGNIYWLRHQCRSDLH